MQVRTMTFFAGTTLADGPSNVLGELRVVGEEVVDRGHVTRFHARAGFKHEQRA